MPNKIQLLGLAVFLGLCTLANAQSFRDQAREAARKGENKKAVELYEKALESATRVFKDSDIELTIRRAELGEAYRAEKRWSDAIKQLDYAWKRSRYDATQKDRWDKQEGDMAMNCAERLARCYQGSGKYDETVKTLQVALDDNAKYNRPLEEATHFLAMLTDMYLLLKQEKEAGEAAKEALDITELTAEEDPLHTALVSSVIGEIYLNHGNVDQARILLQRAVRLAAQHLPPNDNDRAHMQEQLASVLVYEDKLDEAQALLQENITQLARSDKADPETLMGSYLTMANVSLKKGNPEDVINYTQKARELCEANFTQDNPEYARSFLLSGLARVDLRQKDLARKDLQTAYDIMIKTLGEDHPDSVLVRKAMAELPEPAKK